jgi:hypothetical protein
VSTMKMGIMVLLAVTFGVLVIGVLPNQISNFQSPTEMKNLTSRAPSGLGGSFNDTSEEPQVNSNGVVIDKDGNSIRPPPNYLRPIDVVMMELPYYSLWGVNILIAIIALLVARRRM